LGDRNPREVIEATSGHLEQLAGALGREGLELSLAPGKWSARQILCHLADCEIVFGFRLRQTLAEDHHVIQPFDQDEWAHTYPAYSAGEALTVFASARLWNIRLIDSVGPAALAKPLNHPERGGMTFQTLIETMAGHDLNHLAQLRAMAANFRDKG
jgi:hypothetical protein